MPSIARLVVVAHPPVLFPVVLNQAFMANPRR